MDVNIVFSVLTSRPSFDLVINNYNWKDCS